MMLSKECTDKVYTSDWFIYFRAAGGHAKGNQIFFGRYRPRYNVYSGVSTFIKLNVDTNITKKIPMLVR